MNSEVIFTRKEDLDFPIVGSHHVKRTINNASVGTLWKTDGKYNFRIDVFGGGVGKLSSQVLREIASKLEQLNAS